MAARLRRLRGRTWSLLLTVSAVLGTLCLLATLAAPVLNIRPLIFTSGSMSPAIPAGSLALAREVGADDLQVGDVVTVPLHGAYVTHRIVEIAHGPGRATLLLRGDGNDVNDAEAYQVYSAPRTFVSVPRLGSFVAWFSHAPGVYVLAAWVALVLGTVRRGERGPATATERAQRRGPRVSLPAWWRTQGVPRRRGLVSVPTFLGVVLAAPWLTPTATLASDVEPEVAAPATVAAAGPRVPLVWCGITGAHREVTMRWTPVEGATSYRLVFGAHGRTTVHVDGSTTTKTFRDGAHGKVSVKAVSATGLWVSGASNLVTYETSGKGTCA